MDITLDFKSKRVQGTVTLPASKSISNRVLIVNALADSELPIENLADCDDTQSMVRILCSENSYFDVGHADSDAFSDGLSFKDYREVGTDGIRADETKTHSGVGRSFEPIGSTDRVS